MNQIKIGKKYKKQIGKLGINYIFLETSSARFEILHDHNISIS